MVVPAGPKPALIQYWHARRPPADVAALLETCARLNPDMRHLVFDREAAEAFIAAHLSAREVAAFRACAVPAMQADYFRYCAVLVLGGAYVDADFRCVAPVWSLLEGAGAGRLFGRSRVPPAWPADLFGERPRVGPYLIVANSLLLFRRPGHPLLRLAVDLATANVEHQIAEDVAVATGPCVLTSLYLAARLGSLEAFREYAGDGILAASASLFCEVVGSRERVAAAMDGVDVAPFPRSRDAVVAVGDELAYKSTDVHWVNHRGSIFAR